MGANRVGGDGFEGSLVHRGAVRGEQDRGVSLAQWDDSRERFSEMIFDLETAPLVASRKGGRIEDDAVKLLLPAFEAWENVHDVVGVEAVRFGRESVEDEVGFPAVEGFAGQVDAASFGTDAGGGD